MRVNKYRGRRNYDKKWIYGSLLIDCDGDFHIVESEVIKKDGHHVEIDSDFPMFFDNETVGQFTGLHDKNGVEIYEGDIVKCHEAQMQGIIFYDDKNGKFVCDDRHDGLQDMDGLWSLLEVIGNIHESEDK